MKLSNNKSQGKHSVEKHETPQGHCERILQFDQGDLFRKLSGFSIDFIDRKEMLKGSVVLVMSSQNQPSHIYKNDDSVSRILHANEQWPDVLAIAANPELKIVVLNTRLVRKNVMVKDNIYLSPPFSMPGKLLALLFHRFKSFGNESGKGVAIVSADADPGSPEIIQSILLEAAHLNELSPSFLDWIENANRFYSIYK